MSISTTLSYTGSGVACYKTDSTSWSSTCREVSRSCNYESYIQGVYSAGGKFMHIANTTYNGTPIVWLQRLIRLTITTDSAGATSLSFNFGSYTNACSTLQAKVNTSSSVPTLTSGWTTMTRSSSTYTITGLSLLPSTTYYVWIRCNSSADNSTLGSGNYNTSSTVTITSAGTYGQAGNITANNAEFDETVTMSYAASTSGATYVVSVNVNGLGSETLYSGSSSTFVWTPASSTYASQITTAKSVNAVITVKTYYGSTLAGTKTKTITLTFPDSFAPTLSDGAFSITPYNVSPIASLSGYIKGYSAVEADYDSSLVTLSTGASIAKWTVDLGSATATDVSASTASYVSDTISATTEVTCTLVDSRGMTASQTFTATIIPYTPPSATATATRGNYDSDTGVFEEDDEGVYIQIAITNAIYAALEHDGTDQNSLTIQLYSKLASEEDYGGALTLTGGTITENGTNRILVQTNYPTGYDDYTYNLKLVVSDVLGNRVELTYTIASASWFLHSYTNGNGAAFGKAAEYAEELDIGDWKLRSGGMYLTDGSTLVESYLGSMLVVESVTSSSVNISGGGASGDQTIALAKSGYTPIGIVGMACSRGYGHIYKSYISGSTLTFGIFNNHTSALDMTLTAYVLWLKDI